MADNKDKKVLNVPALRFPEFTREWKEHYLAEYLDFKNGLNPSANKFGSGIKFISVMDILNNDFITYDCIRTSVEITPEEQVAFAVEKGDMLFQRSSETLEDVGRANVYMDNRPAVFGGFVIRGKKKAEYNPMFFRYLLASPYARKKIIPMGAGAQHFNIGQDGLSKVKLHFPILQEQQKIAALLRLIDERIATQNKIIEKLETLIKGIVELAFSHAATSNTLGCYITQISQRNKLGKNLPVLSVSNKHGFVEQSEQFEDRIIASDDTSNYKIVNINDFAYNPARINVGSIARLKNKKCGIVSPMYICFRTLGNIIPEYLELFFKTKQFSFEVNKRLEGSVRLCLQYEGLCEIVIPVLPVEKQQIWITRITALYDKLAIEKGLQNNYQVQKQFLLSLMFI